ncbi:cell growth-regulating nucleolar protein isoform 2-T2 [Leptodactylus fuscus]|uniref:cell growth-regulating nucleolar protein isoform X2 n=1 Tax=Leptodactylus fuscus TaxID=238119 RepID=UPI003F4EE801
MVFFCCNACGETLKKGHVEKHLNMCRNCRCLSCIDCGKDFWGNDYKTHLRCLTEDEKYGGKGFEAKAKKGDVKQQQWIQRIQEVMKKPNISNNIRNILNQISTFDNVPRKKTKFQNWMKNCLKIHDPTVQEKVWEIFAEATSHQKDDTSNREPNPSNTAVVEPTPETSADAEETEKKKSKRERKEERQKQNKKEKKDVNSEEQLQNGTKKKGKKRQMEDEENGNDDVIDEEATGKKKKKKRRENEGEDAAENGHEEAPRKKKKRNDSEVKEEEADENGTDENGQEDGGKQGKFNWKGTIKALLKQAPDNELPIKKLRKKVIAQYYTISSEKHRSEEELLGTFNKKIRNNPKFRVLKEKVKLVK